MENDVKVKYLQNLFTQIAKDFRLDVNQAYNLNANTIKYNVDNMELIANSGVSLKVGGSVLTVDGGGIHLKAPNVDTASSNGGVEAKEVKKRKSLSSLRAEEVEVKNA